MGKRIREPDVGAKPANEAYKLLRGGASIFMECDGKREVIKGEEFSLKDVKDHDVRTYFSGKLKVYHAGNDAVRQYEGAALPAKPMGDRPALKYLPEKIMSWTQDDIVGLKLTHDEKRKAEKSVLGEAANTAIARGGIAEKKYSPWAHTIPDHLNFLDREGKSKRVPGYVGANQVHSAFESAAKIYAKKYGSIKVTRELGAPIAGDSGLPSALKLGFALDGKDGSRHHFVHEQPYFTQAGGRNGDEKAIVRFLEIQKERIDRGLPTLADKVTLKHDRERDNGGRKPPNLYESIAVNYLIPKLQNLRVGETAKDDRSVATTDSQPSEDTSSDSSRSGKRQRSDDDVARDRSPERDRSRDRDAGR